MLGPVLDEQNVLSLNFQMTLQEMFYYSHFVDMDPEVQECKRGKIQPTYV